MEKPPTKQKRHRYPYTRICSIAMERFHLTRFDLMTMSWSQLVLMFESFSDDDESRPSGKAEDIRYATEQDWKNWL